MFICIIRSRWTPLVNLQSKDMIDKLHLLYAVYGMAVMFHFMMAWLFIYRRQSRVRILLCSLMTLMGVNYFKDIFFLGNPDNVAGVYSVYSPLIASIDITALPLFVLVLIELCFPRFLTFFKGTVIIAPFALCVALFLSTLSSRIYFLLYALSVVYGILAIILVLWRLPVYRRLILQEYSNINKVHFHWTYYILSCFIAMLITWMIRTATKNMYADMLYIFISIFGWALVANCLVQIETVVKSVIMNGFDDIDAYHTFLADKAKASLSPSLSGFSQIKTTDDGKADDEEPSETIINVENNMGQDDAEASSPAANIADDEDYESSDSDDVDSKGLTAADRTMFAEMSDRLSAIFKEEKIYLDPELRLSTLANRLGTNRTYMSMFFNVYCGTTFCDYVNKYRLDYSKHLLTDSDYTYEIASMSGFNSLSTFRRAFQQMCGCSPKQWRMGEIPPPVRKS